LAEPIDKKPVLTKGLNPYSLSPDSLPSHQRARVEKRLDVGIRAINSFLTCCEGQRLGIFAGSGVGKSVLLSMLARHTACDLCVIALVGERGREVREFIDDVLDEDARKKCIIVVATSDESPLMRKQAAYTSLTIAEYFRDQGLSVLLLMDNVTRFAMAQREIGLSAGEPPTTKGYPPSVFTELSQILERAGPGIEQTTDTETKTGMITGLFTVLVDGDDYNEPISDAVRGILDGHILLDRKIAERGHFPAINILKSVSRMVPTCQTTDEYELIKKARRILSTYEDMSDLIRLGAYKKGNDHHIDEAIELYPQLLQFLSQTRLERNSIEESFILLEKIFRKQSA
jgi:flagellum-specific ATP synthase